MNGEDKRIINMLVQDKDKKYKVVVDNDNICVVDIEKDETIHDFEDFGDEMILELFKYLGVNAEMC